MNNNYKQRLLSLITNTRYYYYSLTNQFQHVLVQIHFVHKVSKLFGPGWFIVYH